MNRYLTMALAMVLACLGLGALTIAPASAHTIGLSGTVSCLNDGSWKVLVKVDVTNTPGDNESETKAINPGAGLSTAGGSGVMAGNQVMLNAWYEHRNNWPGVQTRKGNYSDYYTITVPASQSSVSTMVQIDWKGWGSDDPTKTFYRPDNCAPVYTPQTQKETRDVVDAPDCTKWTVTTEHQERSRTETSKGVWGPWSEWTTTSTSTREATESECKPTAPEGYSETRDLTGTPDCVNWTVTTTHQERDYVYTWNTHSKTWVGAWTDWYTTSTTVTEATNEQCQPPAPEVQKETRVKYSTPTCLHQYVTTKNQERHTLAPVWNAETHTWAQGPWSKWTTTSVTSETVPMKSCERHAHVRVKVTDECNCYRDKVTMISNPELVNVVKTHPSNTTWIFRVSGKTVNGHQYLLPGKIGGNTGWNVQQIYKVHTTNKICPCKKTGTCHKKYPHFTPPADHCRAANGAVCK